MHNKIAHILVVDDDERIRTLLTKYLLKNGYLVTAVGDTFCAREAMVVFKFDLIILDVLLPKELGTDFANELKKILPVTILMLSALDAPLAKVKGLRSGVDDYMTKPFDPEELRLRINNLLKRTAQYQRNMDEIIILDRFKYNKTKNLLYMENKVIKLGTAEHALLAILVKYLNTVVSREELFKHLNVDLRSIDVQINRLRARLEVDPKKPSILHTVRGKGYVLYAH